MVGPSQDRGNPEPSLGFRQKLYCSTTVLVIFGLATGSEVRQKTDEFRSLRR
jgi:hypothetical protein